MTLHERSFGVAEAAGWPGQRFGQGVMQPGSSAKKHCTRSPSPLKHACASRSFSPELLDVERDQFASPKRSGVAEEQQRPVAQRRQIVAHHHEERGGPLDEERVFRSLP